MKHHKLLLIAGAVGVLYLIGKTQGAAAAGVGAGAGAGAGGYYGGGGYGPGYGGAYGGGTPDNLGTQIGGFVSSIFNQFGNNGGGTPYGGLGSVNPALYGTPTPL